MGVATVSVVHGKPNRTEALVRAINELQRQLDEYVTSDLSGGNR